MENKNGSKKERDHENFYVLSLYVTGASPNSARAINNIKCLCENHLPDGYELSIIDVYQQPKIAQTVEIIALPLLIRRSPLPERRLIGDMSDKDKIIKSLGLVKREE